MLPVSTIPGIGRRTSRLLSRSGVRTVGQFLALPELLLTETFGPSLLTVRRRVEQLLPQPASEQQRHAGLFHTLARFFQPA